MKSSKPFVYTDPDNKESDKTFEEILKKNNFKEEKKKWDKILKDSGFEDQELPSGELRSHDTRSLAFENRDMIRDFFLKLDSYLSKATDLKPLYRQILELYSKGTYINDIVKEVGRSRKTVSEIIRRYKKLILSLK